MKFLLRALQYRNYRLFFLGQGVSLIGSWLTTTATSWLVYRIAEGNPMLKAATVLGVVRITAQNTTFLSSRRSRACSWIDGIAIA
jgi:hypothetical protein